MTRKFKLMLLATLVTMMNVNADMMVRMRSINIMPDESGSPTVVGGDVQINSESVPEIDFTYFLNDRIAFELIAATATHKVKTYNSASNTNHDLGDVSLLPPTLLVQYHHTFGKFKPYVGAGLNYTFFYGADPGSHKGINYDNSFGWAAQIGADYELSKDFYVNFDLKRIAISTDVRVDLYAGSSITADVDINPFIAGLGVGHRF
ncbi:MAG: OmpW family protein [Oligoflexia bacterium]|nr:OmpW family protein [Oligoflexia bacterium]